jgi:branched-chain amino acid transport system substrate-binding protein
MIGRTLAAAAVLAVIAGFASPPARAAEKPVEIPVITPITGLGSFLGTQDKITLELGENLINKTGGIDGRPVTFVIYDDQSNPRVALQLLNQISSNQPSVILGSHLVSNCNAMAPLLQNGPLLYCLSPGIHPQNGGYIFSSNVSTHDVELAQIRNLRLRGWTRIALITSTDASGQDGEQGIEEALKLPENIGMKLVERAYFNTTDVSVAAQIEHIKAAEPQAVIVWTTGTPLATVFKALIQSGFDVPIAVSYGNMTYAQMNAYAAFLPKQLYIASAEWPPHPATIKLDPAVEAAQQEFFAAFEEKGLAPDVAATVAWDPMLIVVHALRKLGPEASAAQLRDYIAHLRGYAGVNGVYDFEKIPQRGLNEDDVVVTAWSPEHKTWEVISEPGGVPIDAPN